MNNMKKLFSMMLVVASMVFVFSSCSEKEAELEHFDKSEIYGSWSETSYSPGDYVSSEMKLTWSFYPNNTATERVTLKMNGITMRDVTINFTYTYSKKNSIVLVSDKGNTINYNVYVTGNKMRLGNDEDGYFELLKD